MQESTGRGDLCRVELQRGGEFAGGICREAALRDADVPGYAKELPNFRPNGSCISRITAGTKKASVFPLPVADTPMTSWPVMIAGQAYA